MKTERWKNVKRKIKTTETYDLFRTAVQCHGILACIRLTWWNIMDFFNVLSYLWLLLGCSFFSDISFVLFLFLFSFSVFGVAYRFFFLMWWNIQFAGFSFCATMHITFTYVSNWATKKKTTNFNCFFFFFIFCEWIVPFRACFRLF